jgi:RNA polymerase sigma-70 factor (ECF subfamily)
VINRIVNNTEVAEDIFQDAIVKIWKNGSSYDSSKGRLFTWMLNICRNRAIDILRSKEYKKNLKIQGDENFVINTAEQQTYKFNPDHIGVKEKLDMLEPEYLEAINIVYYGGFTHAEAAEKLNIPLGTLKSRIRIAIRELRKTLVDER